MDGFRLFLEDDSGMRFDDSENSEEIDPAFSLIDHGLLAEQIGKEINR